jgi:2-aminoadipate transaminase
MLEALDASLGAVGGATWQKPRGGLYVWLGLREDLDTGPGGRLLEAALDEGVLYVPGEYCYPLEGQPRRKNFIRLSFGVQTPHNIRRGIAALARAIKRCS